MAALTVAQILLSGRDRFHNAIAIHHGTHHLTYDRVFRDVEIIADRLCNQGIQPGQVVAVDIRQPISHWVVLLALMRIGAVSVSLTDNFEREVVALPSLSAVVCGANESRTYGAARRVPVQSAWLRSPTEATDALPSVSDAEASAGRICFTSGTSGRPKAIMLDAALLRARLSGTARRTRIDARSVFWCGLGPDTAYGFTATVATWLEGAAVVFSGTGRGARRNLADQHVNLVLASPAALDALLRDGPAGSARLQALVIVAGGRLAIPLRDRLVERLCAQVSIAYGSSETGGISFGSAAGLDLHPGNVGMLEHDVEAEVVGEGGEPLPFGSQGQLRVRTSSSALAYLYDPIATAEHFGDGWFRSGDVATISADGRLSIIGRPANILDLGGVKVSADEIDAAAREHDDVDDACTVVISLGGVDQQLAVVIVSRLQDGEGVASRVRSELPMTPRFCLVSVTSIPRGSMGKVNRDALAKHVERALAARPGEGATDGVRLLGAF